MLASSIPVLALISDSLLQRWATAIAGAVVAILEGIKQLNQFSRLWIEYRAMSEALKREKVLFLAGVGVCQVD